MTQPADIRTAPRPRPRDAGLPVPLPVIPERYQIRESEDGTFLHCDEAPRARVRIDPKLCVSDAEAREMGQRSIFLDGAGDFAPLLDNKARLYNLDHHQGCIRPFTLATCEQALVLVLNGLELDSGDWTLYANEPDLDTVLAIWVMLNFRRIPDLSDHSKDILLPLLRLEGAIDANGTELADYCGLPREALREARERLDSLYETESRWRQDGRNRDGRQYTAAMLAEIDRLVYTGADFRDHTSIEEILGHVELVDGKVAVACRDQSGIYEAERILKSRFGEQLGLIALEKSTEGDRHHYTLRRVSAVLGFDLEPAFGLLNLLDPMVDGRPAGKRWGGSLDIGGSPRPGGTRFQPSELLKLIEAAYRTRTTGEKVRPWIGSTFCTAALVVWGVVAFLLATVVPVAPGSPLHSLGQAGRGLLGFSTVALLVSLPLTWWVSRRRLWLHGWRRPAGKDWLYLAPVAVAAGLPASAWVPRDALLDPTSLSLVVGVVGATGLAWEAWFRGLIHGWFLFAGPVQRVEGPWFASRATLISTLFYAMASVIVPIAWIFGAAKPSLTPLEIGVAGAAAIAGGLSLGVIRERTLSIWPGVLLQLIGGLAGAALLRSGVTGL